jgi:hypothetical protein
MTAPVSLFNSFRRRLKAPQGGCCDFAAGHTLTGGLEEAVRVFALIQSE